MFIALTKTDGTVLGIDTIDIKMVEGPEGGPSRLTMKCGCGGYKPNGELKEEVVHEVKDLPREIISQMRIPTSINYGLGVPPMDRRPKYMIQSGGDTIVS